MGVAVFSFPLDPPPDRLALLASSLSADEHVRAARFRFERDRVAFVACRGTVREILGERLGMPPAAVAFAYDAHGKPRLAPPSPAAWDDPPPSPEPPSSPDPFPTPSPEQRPLAFSITHTAGLGLCAVCADEVSLGVDLERHRALPDALAIAARFFAPAERMALAALDPAAREAAFFDVWTRKEAFVKAIGAGISYPLASFEVAADAHAPARLLRVDGEHGPAARWSLVALEPAPGYSAALAVDRPAVTVVRWSWIGRTR